MILKFENILSLNGTNINSENHALLLQQTNEHLENIEFVEITDSKEQKDELIEFEVMCKFKQHGRFKPTEEREKIRNKLNIDIASMAIMKMFKTKKTMPRGIVIVRKNNLAEILWYGRGFPTIGYVIGEFQSHFEKIDL
jgi:hypothetical protein